MDANNSELLPVSAGQQASVHILGNSECEEIVYWLAKTSSYKRVKCAVEVLCPTCKQNFMKLLTTPNIDKTMREFREIS